MGKKKDRRRAKRAEKKARKTAGLRAQQLTEQPAPGPVPASAATLPPTIRSGIAAASVAPPPPANTPPDRQHVPKPEENREITVRGNKYTMALSFNDLCDGEVAGNGKWKENVSLLDVYSSPGQIRTARDAFAISLERFHPDIPFRERRSLLTWPTILQAAIHIYPLFHRNNHKPEETVSQ